MQVHASILLAIQLLTLFLIPKPTLEAHVHISSRTETSDTTADEDFLGELTDDSDDNYDYDITNETVNLHRIQLVDRFGFGTAQDEPLSPELIEEFITYANERQKQDPQNPITTMRPLENDSPTNSSSSGFAIGSLGQGRCPKGCSRYSYDQKCHPDLTNWEQKQGGRQIICQPNAHIKSSGTQFQLSQYLVMLISIVPCYSYYVYLHYRY